MARKTKKTTTASTAGSIRRNSRKRYSGEEKIRTVLEGLRSDETVADLCWREGISESVCDRWSNEFQEAGKRRLVVNMKRQANGDEVVGLRREIEQLKQLVAELALKNRVLKKSVLGLENGWES